MKIQALTERFSICQMNSEVPIDLSRPFTFAARTDEELSLVCPTADIPEDTVKREDGWRAFRIQGTLDFSLIGILSRISGILAEEKVGIFAVSTYNTDYILTKEEHFRDALDALRRNGYSISEEII